jgi:hypothetical protein
MGDTAARFDKSLLVAWVWSTLGLPSRLPINGAATTGAPSGASSFLPAFSPEADGRTCGWVFSRPRSSGFASTWSASSRVAEASRAAAPPSANVVAPFGSVGAETDLLRHLATTVAAPLDKTELAALIEAFERTRQLPKDVDRQLLSGGRSALRRDLDPTEKKRVRSAFVDLCRRRLIE